MKAIVVGATGLVGKNIVAELLKKDVFTEVKIFVRRPLGISHLKLSEMIVDFDFVEDWGRYIAGDVLFSALGTTLKTAGSKAAQYLVDHDYQLNIAKTAAKNGVSKYVLISSVNANEKSLFFYLKMKGKLENEILKLPFNSITILRPGPLKGPRENFRPGEAMSAALLEKIPSFLVSPSVRPVEGEQVAKIGVRAALSEHSGTTILEARDILQDHIQ